MMIYKPSRLVRWPLHMLNALLILVIACLAGSIALFVELEQEPLWALVFAGGGVCLLFVVLNLAVTGMRLRLGEEGAVLAVLFWRRAVPWRGVGLVKEVREVGLTAVRLRSEDGTRELYLNPSWFDDFEGAVAEMERRATAGGGTILSKHQERLPCGER
jgi:hypothetical protein